MVSRNPALLGDQRGVIQVMSRPAPLHRSTDLHFSLTRHLRYLRRTSTPPLHFTQDTKSSIYYPSLIMTEQFERMEHTLPRLVDMRQGEKVHPVFSTAEFERRHVALREYMAENGIGACVFTSYYGVNYYSGFMYVYFGRHYGVVVTQDDVTLISAAVDGGQPWRRSQGAQHNLIYTDWHRDNFFYAVKKAIGDAQGKIGLEFDHITLDTKVKFDAALSQKMVDISGPAMRLRASKSAEEQELTRQGVRIAIIGAKAAIASMREGITEAEMAQEAVVAMNKEILKTYPEVEQRDTFAFLQTGINTDGAHNNPTNRRLQKGDIISLNTFAMIAGYYSAFERTLFFEHASEAHLRIWRINVEVYKRGLELIKPGVRCCDIASQLNAIYHKYDVMKYKPIGYGHAFGPLCHYYGRDAVLELRESCETVLEPGMILSMEPMLTIPEGEPGAGGYRDHDTLIVTQDGAENIGIYPTGPPECIIKS